MAGFALTWRAHAALTKALTIAAFGFWELCLAVWGFVADASPDALAMGVVGTVALIANAAVTLILFRFRSGDANMRSVRICSRNDAIGKTPGSRRGDWRFGTGQAWPIYWSRPMTVGLALSGGFKVLARGPENRGKRVAWTPCAAAQSFVIYEAALPRAPLSPIDVLAARLRWGPPTTLGSAPHRFWFQEVWALLSCSSIPTNSRLRRIQPPRW